VCRRQGLQEFENERKCFPQQHLDQWFPKISALGSATSFQGIHRFISEMATLKFIYFSEINFLIKGMIFFKK
jgi:hypothetical protein